MLRNGIPSQEWVSTNAMRLKDGHIPKHVLYSFHQMSQCRQKLGHQGKKSFTSVLLFQTQKKAISGGTEVNKMETRKAPLK